LTDADKFCNCHGKRSNTEYDDPLPNAELLPACNTHFVISIAWCPTLIASAFSLVPSVRLAARALRLRSLTTAESAFVTPLFLFGFRNHGRYLQPSAVTVHGHEGQIRGGDLL